MNHKINNVDFLGIAVAWNNSVKKAKGQKAPEIILSLAVGKKIAKFRDIHLIEFHGEEVVKIAGKGYFSYPFGDETSRTKSRGEEQEIKIRYNHITGVAKEEDFEISEITPAQNQTQPKPKLSEVLRQQSEDSVDFPPFLREKLAQEQRK